MPWEVFGHALAQLHAIRQAGQRIVVRQIANPCVGQALFGHIGIAVHEAAIGQQMAAHLDYRAVLARDVELAVVSGDLSSYRCSRWIACGQLQCTARSQFWYVVRRGVVKCQQVAWHAD